MVVMPTKKARKPGKKFSFWNLVFRDPTTFIHDHDHIENNDRYTTNCQTVGHSLALAKRPETTPMMVGGNNGKSFFQSACLQE